MFRRMLFIIASAACILVLAHGFPAVSATESESSGFKKRLWKVEVHRSVMGKPALATVWRQYGEMKANWRSEKFFEVFPTETKYRYTFREELECRKFLAEKWEYLKKTSPRFSDEYLDNLVKVKNSRYFDEYIYTYFREGSWHIDKDRLYLEEFKKWCKINMKGSKKETRIDLVEVELAEW